MIMIKQKMIDAFLWIKAKVMENKQRAGAMFCAILALFGFFMPFMSAKADISVTGIMNNTVAVVSPDYDMINFSLGDFVLQKPIDDFEVYGVPLGNIKILDQSVLDILRNPLPDKGYVSSVNEALSSPALDYLVDPKVQEIIATRLNNGESINAILRDIWNVVQSARDIASKVNDVTIQARQSMDQVNATMATIDGYKATANGAILILFLVVIGLVVLILYKRASIKLSIFISSLLSALFIAVGVGTAVANNKINEQLASIASQVNSGIVDMLRAVLTGTFGEIGTFIANYISGQANFLLMIFTIQLRAGYWIILLGLIGCLIFLIFTARKEKNRIPASDEIVLIETSEEVEPEVLIEAIEDDENIEIKDDELIELKASKKESEDDEKRL
ncbi:MAG: hypothetical protein L6276_11640 [Acetobacterium sp.]|nr:hypothetical protein [Bacillota bacterium]MCG2730908.1 hypothetical protein [Acetobacterium sp.]